VLAIALVAGTVHLLSRKPQRTAGEESWSQLVAIVSMIVVAVLVAVANLRSPEVPWGVLVGVVEPREEDIQREISPAEDASLTSPGEAASANSIDWATELTPRGAETRLADAVRYVIEKERGGSIAGIVLITDGGQNAGVETNVAITESQDAAISLYAMGLGSD